MSRLGELARQAMQARGLLPDFSDAARRQTADLKGPAQDASPVVRDLRSLLWASIDNDDSRDLDQLTVADGGAEATRILVAIADVDALVGIGSPIDEHARTNTTSVYTAAQIFPMLPERLSTDLTSLADNEDRLALVIDMQVQSDGQLSASQIYRAQVRNRAKLAYNSVGAWLEGRGPMPPKVANVPGMDAQLRLQDRVAQTLRTARRAAGALELQSLEAEPVFENGALLDLRVEQSNRAMQLIEDFMIAANGVTARFLQSQQRASIRRILRTPKRWERIVDLATDLGERLPAEPNAQALNQFLARRLQADPARFGDLSLSVIKLLGAGEYALELPGHGAPGHFALAVRDYTHATAPNRRFPDLLTQRLLKAALASQPAPYSDSELSALAAHCTAQEANAAKVERQIRKSAAAMLLSTRVGQRFDAIVTGSSDKGVWVRIDQPAAEGRVVRGAAGLDVGDRLQVQLLNTDVERGFIDFGRV